MTEKKNPLLSKGDSLALAWKERLGNTYGLAGTSFHNSWRSIVFTIKGKKIGFNPRWQKFSNFVEDMHDSYSEGKCLWRKDKKNVFSKENCSWINKEDLHSSRIIMLNYEGESRSLKEWCYLYDLNLAGVRKRYHHKKEYSSYEILFGYQSKPKKTISSISSMCPKKIRSKASKMISSYKCKDKKRSLSKCDFDIDWFIDNILQKECVYCGTKEKLGADRLDNSMGHTKDNIVPCCFRCNIIKHDHFTYDQMIKIGNFLKESIDNQCLNLVNHQNLN